MTYLLTVLILTVYVYPLMLQVFYLLVIYRLLVIYIIC